MSDWGSYTQPSVQVGNSIVDAAGDAVDDGVEALSGFRANVDYNGSQDEAHVGVQ
eukprot:CAMPEP_0206130004 /NCGR_PEP_ID=MMETSP1472-20131121/38731_1 /ASSEMBLY_ACC=CAM_ASM_001108 /TAXON_ID=41880 /ORGANISM="Pycnococcus provasolii, Strain RCC251" /LENGTH=54 /DNA_ID=CAMNT_0053521309 /DNA_START=30 /DNA_END=191 /DNA_ORIENTATION=+